MNLQLMSSYVVLSGWFVSKSELESLEVTKPFDFGENLGSRDVSRKMKKTELNCNGLQLQACKHQSTRAQLCISFYSVDGVRFPSLCWVFGPK